MSRGRYYVPNYRSNAFEAFFCFTKYHHALSCRVSNLALFPAITRLNDGSIIFLLYFTIIFRPLFDISHSLFLNCRQDQQESEHIFLLLLFCSRLIIKFFAVVCIAYACGICTILGILSIIIIPQSGKKCI